MWDRTSWMTGDAPSAARGAEAGHPPPAPHGGPQGPALRPSDAAPGRGRTVAERFATVLGALRHNARPAASDATHRCPLCGREFTAAEAAACPTCPIAERCGLVMCPGCGYEFPPS